MTLERRKQQVREALASVRDPEIDESIASLDFVDDVFVNDGEVEVVIRPPTAWCPSNFVFLIAEDMRAAVLSLHWVQRFKVRLIDHFAEHEITSGINAQRPFASVFPGQAGNRITNLRREFDSKAFLMRQRKLLRALQKRGIATEILLTMTTAQARAQAASDEERTLLADYLEKRQAIGIDAENQRLILDISGRPISDLNAHFREIRMIAANAAANGEMCRMMVSARQQISQMSCSSTVIPIHPKPTIREEARQ